MLLRENIPRLWGFNRGDLNISASAVPSNKDIFKTKRTESYNILSCSNNKTIYGNGIFVVVLLFLFFLVIINELLRDNVIAIWNSI